MLKVQKISWFYKRNSPPVNVWSNRVQLICLGLLILIICFIHFSL